MNTVPVWYAGPPATNFPSLPGDEETDVVIVGGGITGHHARGAAVGHRAARDRARSTARRGRNNGSLHRQPVRRRGPDAAVAFAWDTETAKRVVESRLEAIDLIESIARTLSVECGFRRVPQLIYAVDSSSRGRRSVRIRGGPPTRSAVRAGGSERCASCRRSGAEHREAGAVPSARLRARSGATRRVDQLPDLREHPRAGDRPRRAHGANRTRHGPRKRSGPGHAHAERHLRAARRDDRSPRIRGRGPGHTLRRLQKPSTGVAARTATRYGTSSPTADTGWS